jgi:hypothetical protein
MNYFLFELLLLLLPLEGIELATAVALIQALHELRVDNEPFPFLLRHGLALLPLLLLRTGFLRLRLENHKITKLVSYCRYVYTVKKG